MEFSDESYVRLFVRDTKTWLRLGFEGQCVLMFTLRKLDRAGVLDGMEEPAEDLALMTGVPLAIVSVGLTRLLERGVFVLMGTSITMPNYVKAQNCRQSDKLRQQESRLRRSLEAVTNRDGMSPAVTSGHNSSPIVTPSLAQPILTKPTKTQWSDQLEEGPETLRLAKGCPSSSSDAQSLGTTLGARDLPPEQPSSAFPESTQPSVIPTVLREIPDGMALPEDVRQDARIIGLTDAQIDHYWGELCKGPIGGTRGILQKRFGKYLRDLPKQWKVWADVEKARSSHTIKRSGASGARGGSGVVQERPGSGWAPEQRGRMYAERFKLSVDEMARAYRRSLADGQVLSSTELDEGFLKFMAAEVAKKRKVTR